MHIVSRIHECQYLPLDTFNNTCNGISLSNCVVNPCISSSIKWSIYYDDMVNCSSDISISIRTRETNLLKEIETYKR